MYTKELRTPYDEEIEVKDKIEDCSYLFGGTDFFITEEDFNLLRQGKIINFSVNGEYGCTLQYDPKGRYKNRDILNELKTMAETLVSICDFECCNYGFDDELELADKIVEDKWEV